MNRSDRNTPVNDMCDRHDCEMCKNQKECIEYTSEKIMKRWKHIKDLQNNQWSI